MLQNQREISINWLVCLRRLKRLSVKSECDWMCGWGRWKWTKNAYLGGGLTDLKLISPDSKTVLLFPSFPSGWSEKLDSRLETITACWRSKATNNWHSLWNGGKEILCCGWVCWIVLGLRAMKNGCRSCWGMVSPHVVFHIVNKGIFSDTESNAGKIKALLLLETRSCVCWLLNIWVNCS